MAAGKPQLLDSDWPPAWCLHCGLRRTGTEGEAPVYACACVGRARLFGAYNFPQSFIAFPEGGLIAALVSGGVWRSRWLCMVTAYQSCSALAQLDRVAPQVIHTNACNSCPGERSWAWCLSLENNLYLAVWVVFCYV